jgi:hypothetical protein
MKTFADASFFRLFDLLLNTSNPGLKLPQWSVDGVTWERERHSFTGSTYSFAMEVFTLTRSGRRGWALMVVKEYWWAGKNSDSLKSLHWARPINGRRTDVIAWLREQELELDRQTDHRAPAAAEA